MKTQLSRRHALVTSAAAAAATALLPMREVIAANTSARGGDWLAMVKVHHAMIAKTFDQLISAGDKQTYLQRNRLLMRLSYELTAHSVAEENVIYPALASAGMVSESDKLYMEQAHAKVMNAQLDMMAMHHDGDAGWLDKAKELQAAVLKHAKEDEEADAFPKLQKRLDAKQNAALTAGYKAQFDSVKPVRDRSA